MCSCRNVSKPELKVGTTFSVLAGFSVILWTIYLYTNYGATEAFSSSDQRSWLRSESRAYR